MSVNWTLRFLLLPIVLLVGLVPATSEEIQRRIPSSSGEMKLSFAPLVRQASPAVVNIYTKTIVREQRRSPFADDPFFRRFFGNQRRGAPRERMSSSLGSGVIVDPSGLVVTNFHVIRNATEVRIALADRRELEAEIVVGDERTDLAVLRIKDADEAFPFLEFEDSDLLEVGDLVLAIGNPFGVGQTVTSGIVSALARNRVGVSDYQFFIQTDAAINPGNSGGALLDMNGRLVGINTAIYSRSGGSNGIGFAIPANMVKVVVQSVNTGGEVLRPWFGARLQGITADIAEGLGLETPQGVLIVGLHPRSPAAEAGLGVGDVVLEVEGVAVNEPDGFGYRFATKGTKGKVPLGILRGGERFDVEVALSVPAEDPPRDARVIEGRSPLAGATIVNISPAIAFEYRLDNHSIAAEGVLITEVDPRSPARSAGLRSGDIIVSINQQDVQSTRQITKIAERRSRAWRIQIDRRGRILTSTFNG